MANKFKPGIPDGFSLNVAPVADLGDYLDEPSPTRPMRPREREPRKPTSPVAQPVTIPIVPPRPVAAADPVARSANVEDRVSREQPEVAAPIANLRPPFTSERANRAPRHTGPRREVNMSPETLRMTDELLELIRSGSGQRDTKANELIHALVLLAYEVRDDLDPHALPKRGRWGSPTARAYPLEIKNALLQAVEKKLLAKEE